MVNVRGDDGLRLTPEEQEWLAWAEGRQPPHHQAPVAAAAHRMPFTTIIIAIGIFLALLRIFHDRTHNNPVRQSRVLPSAAASRPVSPPSPEMHPAPEPPVDISGISSPISTGDIRLVQVPMISFFSPPPPPPEPPPIPIQAVARNDQVMPCKGSSVLAAAPAEFRRPLPTAEEYSSEGAYYVPTIPQYEADYPTAPPRPKKRRSVFAKINPFPHIGRAVRNLGVLEPFRSYSYDRPFLRELPTFEFTDHRRSYVYFPTQEPGTPED